MDAGVAVVLAVVPVAMTVIVGAATVTGEQKALCERMGGTYNANAAFGDNVCPGGSWLKLFESIPRTSSQPAPTPAPEPQKK